MMAATDRLASFAAMSTAERAGTEGQTSSTARARSHKRNGKGAATRDRVIQSAEECIAELGFNRTSSLEVARRSGVTFGVIQYHFGTYEAVLIAVVERAAAGLSSMLENAVVSGPSTRQKVQSIADIVWSYYEAAPVPQLHRDHAQPEPRSGHLRAGVAQLACDRRGDGATVARADDAGLRHRRPRNLAATAAVRGHAGHGP